MVMSWVASSSGRVIGRTISASETISISGFCTRTRTSLWTSGFSRAIYLELKTGNVEETRRKIVAFGVRVLEVRDPHLYFQAPGGQVLRLVGIDEDLSRQEGTDHRELLGAFR